MDLLLMGGWMMWPLTLISVTVTAIIIERLLLFSSFRFPSRRMTELLEEVVRGNRDPLFAELEKVAALRRFSALLAAKGPGREAALRIEGDSMKDAGILDGDTAVIKKADTANNGEIVVALIDNNEATLKILQKKGAEVWLVPCNKDYETRKLDAKRVKVQGVLSSIIRNYH